MITHLQHDRLGPAGTRALDSVVPRATDPASPADAPREKATDEPLLDRYRRGDGESFAALVHRYHRELFHFLVHILGDRGAAEDVFQETFLQVHQSAAQFDPSRSFRPWLFTIAANKARDRLRAQARRPTLPLHAHVEPGAEGAGTFAELVESSAEAPGEQMEREEQRKRVRDAVLAMPGHLREVLLLSYFHRFPYQQIGDILGIPLGTVKSRLHAAVTTFADRWRELEEGRAGRHASPNPGAQRSGPGIAKAGRAPTRRKCSSKLGCVGRGLLLPAAQRMRAAIAELQGRLHPYLEAPPDLVHRTVTTVAAGAAGRRRAAK